MSAPRDRATRAIVLHVTPYGDADQICRLFAEYGGRTTVFARRSRGSKRRFRGGLGACRCVRATLRRRREGAMPLLMESDVLHDWLVIGEHVHRLAAASWLSDLLVHALEEGEGDAAAFERVYRFFLWLSKEDDIRRMEAGLHRMELLLLGELGLLPDFSVSCRSGLDSTDLSEPHWHPDSGLMDQSERHPGEETCVVGREGLAYLAEVLGGRFPGADHDAGRLTLRRELPRIWRHHLGRELKSRAWVESVFGEAP